MKWVSNVSLLKESGKDCTSQTQAQTDWSDSLQGGCSRRWWGFAGRTTWSAAGRRWAVGNSPRGAAASSWWTAADRSGCLTRATWRGKDDYTTGQASWDRGKSWLCWLRRYNRWLWGDNHRLTRNNSVFIRLGEKGCSRDVHRDCAHWGVHTRSSMDQS